MSDRCLPWHFWALCAALFALVAAFAHLLAPLLGVRPAALAVALCFCVVIVSTFCEVTWEEGEP